VQLRHCCDVGDDIRILTLIWILFCLQRKANNEKDDSSAISAPTAIVDEAKNTGFTAPGHGLRGFSTADYRRRKSMFVQAFVMLTMSSRRSSSSVASRSRFLPSLSSAFIAALSTSLWNPSDQCDALESLAESELRTEGNPRHLNREIQMQYDNNNSRTRGNLSVRRFTGDSTPYTFPVQPIRLARETAVYRATYR
jgi:hypothetical protein